MVRRAVWKSARESCRGLPLPLPVRRLDDVVDLFFARAPPLPLLPPSNCSTASSKSSAAPFPLPLLLLLLAAEADAAMNSWTGIAAAAEHSSWRSLPENPRVAAATSASGLRGRAAPPAPPFPPGAGVLVRSSLSTASSPASSTCLASVSRRIASRCASSGSGTSNCAENRRSTASSRSKGRLVAARTITLELGSVEKPSQSCMNSVFMAVTASCSWSRRLPRRASTSSTKMIDGWSLEAFFFFFFFFFFEFSFVFIFEEKKERKRRRREVCERGFV